MLNIPVIKGNINKALKQFKRKFRDTQVLRELRERKNYTKKSLKRKIQKEEAIRKFKKQQEDE
jgi:small subunit ribosomal protein S21|tara:strand:- start:381 stop:569 length:189 start_codon:yes stop_codon:yes gene_type:complete